MWPSHHPATGNDKAAASSTRHGRGMCEASLSYPSRPCMDGQPAQQAGNQPMGRMMGALQHVSGRDWCLVSYSGGGSSPPHGPRRAREMVKIYPCCLDILESKMAEEQKV